MLKNQNRLSFIRPEKSPIFYGYVIAVVGTIGVIASMPGQTIGVSTFTDPVKDALGLNRDQFSNAYMIGTILSSLLLGKAGKLFDKYGARWLSFFASLGLGVSLILCASSEIISSNIKQFTHTDHWIIPFIIMTILFFLIRFTGQGVLTMSSRNMIMKWFDHYRGRVNAVRSIIVSLAFSISPLWISLLIDGSGWSQAWVILAIVVFAMSALIFIFYRDTPENHQLLPDGKKLKTENPTESEVKYRQFTLDEALKTRAFWAYALTIAFYSFFVTGLTFHVVSIFEHSGFSKDQAIGIFLPISVISVILSLVGNILADFMKLNYFLFTMQLGGILSAFGLLFLNQSYGMYLLIAGIGILGGMFAVLNAITWPRFYGRKHLGAITGKLMSLLVFGSALAPSLFSLSKTYLSDYNAIGIISLVYLLVLVLISLKVKNTQEQ